VTTYPEIGNQSQKSRRSLFLLLITYLLLFGPKFYIADITVITACGLAIYFLFREGVRGKISTKILYLWVYIAAILFYFFLVSATTSNDPYPLAMEFGKLILYIASAAGLVELYRVHYLYEYAVPLLQDIFRSILATAFLVVALFLFPDVRYELYSSVDLYLFHGRDPKAIVNRITDLSIGGSTVSLVLLFGAISLADGRIWQANHGSGYRMALFYLLFAVATLLTGRTGFMLLLATSAIWLTYRSVNAPLLVLKTIGRFALVTVAVILLTITYINIEVAEQFVDKIAPWAFELLYSFVDTGNFQSETGGYILSQYILPDSLSGFLFGGGGYDIPPDSIFVKLLHSVGLLGVTLSAFMFVVAMKGKRQELTAKYLNIYLGILLIGNLKETMLGNSRGAIIIFLILAIAAKRGKDRIHVTRNAKASLPNMANCK